MAIVFASATGIVKRASGYVVKSVFRSTAQTGDVTVAIDMAKVTDKGAALAAAHAIIDSLLSDTLK